jgi:PadR family transcriptional regulator PadR
LYEEAKVPSDASTAMSARDWHVLLALVERDLHGYGIMKAVERDSGGKVTVEVGSLYRILDRLMEEGMVEEVDAPDHAPSETRGRPRRYFRLAEAGQAGLRRETMRLRDALDLARTRRLLPEPPR